jgi:hypothetical protein
MGYLQFFKKLFNIDDHLKNALLVPFLNQFWLTIARWKGLEVDYL